MTLTPSKRVVLLPEDYEIMRLLGVSKEEYIEFNKQLAKYHKFEPSEVTAFGPLAIGLIFVGLGLIAGVAAAFFGRSTPSPAKLEARTIDGQDIVTGSRFAPKTGFDSAQNVVELNSVVPLIYAKRETIGGVTYGGVRVNTNLLWLQILSVGGSQMLKAILLIGQGGLGAIEPTECAIGNNILTTYDLATGADLGSKATLYYSGDGGRLTTADYLAGRAAAEDLGNSQNDGGPDVYSIRGLNNAWTQSFCYAAFPSNQTSFGLYAPIGNNLSARVNPTIRPAVVATLVPSGDDGDARVRCNNDVQVRCQRQKQNVWFTSRCYINGTPFVLNNATPGSTCTLVLDDQTDAEYVFRFSSDGPDGALDCFDIGQTIAGRLKTYDDNLVEGEIYKIGTALAVLVSRSENRYISEADNDPVGNGSTVTATFRFLTAGQYHSMNFDQEPTLDGTYAVTGTKYSHLFRVAIAGFALDRPAQNFEIGFESAMGIRISGLCNFRGSSSYSTVDNEACEDREDDEIPKGSTLETKIYNSGIYSGPEFRYSFFRLGYRIAGTDDDFTYVAALFGFRSQTSVAMYNYLRVQMPRAERWELTFLPVSGWEVRQRFYGDVLYVIDFKEAQRSVFDSGITFTFNGVQVPHAQSTFALPQLYAATEPTLGIPTGDGNSHDDDWGKLSELFNYEEISANLTTPEHRVAYVNIIMPNASMPTYENLAILGLNIRSSTEFRTLTQVSAYVKQGLANTHLFPEILQDLLTNTEYGAGSLFPAFLIDQDSFTFAANWNYNRRYFYDGVIVTRTNVPSWGNEIAKYFLLDLVRKNGRYYLQPSIDFDQPVQVTGSFSSGNIVEGTLNLQIIESDQRLRPRITVKWREERVSGTLSERGLFPVLREVTVREIDTPENAPLINIDVSDWCTSEIQAVDIAKSECRKVRYATHQVQFEAVPAQAALDLGKVFELGVDEITYGESVSGAILPNRTTWPALADGSYDALFYGPSAGTPTEITFTVTNGVANVGAGMYSIKRVRATKKIFKLASLDFTEEGNLAVAAVSYPLNDAGFALMGLNWDTGFVVEGLTVDYSVLLESVSAPYTGSSTSTTAAVWTASPPGQQAAYTGGVSRIRAARWTASV